MKRALAKILFFAAVGTSIFLPFRSFAQVDVEKATKENDRLEKMGQVLKTLEPTTPEVIDQTKPKDKPAQASGKKVFIKKIELSGNDNLSRGKLSFLLEKYENKELKLEDLNTFCREIESEYLKNGLVAAAFIPEQEIKDQVVFVAVVEAKMGEVEIADHKFFRKERLLYYWDIPAGEVLRYDKLSRSLQMMNKNPDRKVKATLRAGKIKGTTDVVLAPETTFPAHFSYSFDGEGEAATGKYRSGLGLRHNNLLGFDDLFFSGTNFGKNFDSKYVYHLIPVSPKGASLLYGYSASKSVPQKDYAQYGIFSQSQNVSISLRQDLYDAAVYKGEVYAGFDAKDKTVVLNTGTYNRDRLRVLRLGGKWLSRDFKGSLILSPEISQGLGILGASPRNNPLSSRGAKSVFTKVNLGIQHKREFFFDWELNSKVQTQISLTKLTPQEAIAFGGIDSIRGYPAGDYLGDNGLVVNEELLLPGYFIPPGLTIPGSIKPLRDQTNYVLFVDYGKGYRRAAIAAEKRSNQLLGLGTGLRFKIFRRGSCRLEWGFPLGDDPITQTCRSYFHFSFDFQY